MRLDSGIIIIPRIWDHEIIMGLADAEAQLDKVFYFVFVRVKLVVVELTNALMYIWIFRFILPASFCPFWFVKLTAGSMQHHCSANTCLLQIANWSWHLESSSHHQSWHRDRGPGWCLHYWHLTRNPPGSSLLVSKHARVLRREERDRRNNKWGWGGRKRFVVILEIARTTIENL